MQNDDLIYVLPGIASSLFSVFTKGVNYPLLMSRDNLIKSYNDGLYHITSNEAADAILDSKEMHASNRLASYGIHKRCFFFAGLPDFENVCVNCTPNQTLTAIRVKLPYEKLAEFDRRNLNDGAITYKGDLNLDGAVVEKVRLGLKEQAGKLVYSQISEEEYQNFKLNLSEEKLKLVENKMAFYLRSLCVGIRQEFEMFKKDIKAFLKDETSGLSIVTRKSLIEQNKDLFATSVADETSKESEAISAEISVEKQARQLFQALTDKETKYYQIGDMMTDNRDDVKTEILKGVVISTISNINHGLSFSLDVKGVSGERDNKDIAFDLYENICSGNIESCYAKLNDSDILFSACKTYFQMQHDQKRGLLKGDNRVGMLTQELDIYNSNMKNDIGQITI